MIKCDDTTCIGFLLKNMLLHSNVNSSLQLNPISLLIILGLVLSQASKGPFLAVPGEFVCVDTNVPISWFRQFKNITLAAQ